MRVAFAGTPPFAARALGALLAAGHEVCLVLTQPDRPAGRGLKLTPSAVAQLARKHALRVHQPDNLRSPEAQEPIRSSRPDVVVVAAYGLILPQAVLDIPQLGCINIHASLLPRWRGAAPIQRALLAGDSVTGVCIMRMDAGLDTGSVLLEKQVAIGDRDTAGTLTERLAKVGAASLVEALADLSRLEARPQPEAGITYAGKVGSDESRIDWTLSNRAVDRLVRGLNPAPGAQTLWEGERIKVWEAHPVAGRGFPGEILGEHKGALHVACGEGVLALTNLQRAGARRLPAADFLRGSTLPAGARLGG